MGELRIKLDEFTPNSQPRGLEELMINIVFSYAERTLIQEPGEANIQFTGDAYDYLYTSLRSSGYNGVHDVEILKRMANGEFASIYTGNLFISDCNFDLDKRFCDVDIMDSGYNSYIKNNRELETNFTIAKSKNGDALQVITFETVEMINPPSNTIPAVGLNAGTGTTRQLFNVTNVLAHFVRFMSDDKLDYQSDYFADLFTNTGTKYGLIRGVNLRQGSTNTLIEGQLSFAQVWDDVSKWFNLVLSVDTSTGTPTVRLEDLPYYQNEDIVMRKNNVAGIKRSYLQQLLYGRITIGSGQAVTDNSVGALTYLPPYDFGQDTYYLSGVSNLDSTLEARGSNLISDSNIIEDVLTNNNDAYDEDWFLIEYDGNDLEALTDASDIFNDSNYYFNGTLTNKQIVSRYNLQGSAVKMVGDPDGDFQGRKGSDETSDYNGAPSLGLPYSEATRVLTGNFDTVIADPSGAWSTVTSRYTADASGMRNVRLQHDSALSSDWSFVPPYDIFIPPTNYLIVYLVKVRFKVNGSYLVRPIQGSGTGYIGDDADTVILMDYQTGGLGINSVVVSENIYLTAGDYLEAEIGVIVGQMNIKDRGYFNNGNRTKLLREIPNPYNNIDSYNSNLQITGGLIDTLSSTSMVIETQGAMNGVPISNEKQDGFFVNRFEFEDTIDANELQSFLTSPQKSIFLNNQEHGLNLKAWAYNVSINASTGKTTYELFNNINSI